MSDQLPLRLCRWCGRLAIPDRSVEGAYVCAACRKDGGTDLLAPPHTHTTHSAHAAGS